MFAFKKNLSYTIGVLYMLRPVLSDNSTDPLLLTDENLSNFFSTQVTPRRGHYYYRIESVKHENMCLDPEKIKDGSAIYLKKCNKAKMWEYNDYDQYDDDHYADYLGQIWLQMDDDTHVDDWLCLGHKGQDMKLFYCNKKRNKKEHKNTRFTRDGSGKLLFCEVDADKWDKDECNLGGKHQQKCMVSFKKNKSVRIKKCQTKDDFLWKIHY